MAKDDKKPATGNDNDDKNDESLGDAGKRALNAEREARRKAEADLKTAREELATVKVDQDASKSDMEKVLAKVEGLEQRAEKAERKALVSEVASAKGVPAGLLTGSTKEELEAQADQLLEFKGGKAGDGDSDGDDPPGDKGDKGGNGDFKSSGRPKENLRPGAAGDDSKAEMSREDAHKLAASIDSGGF